MPSWVAIEAASGAWPPATRRRLGIPASGEQALDHQRGGIGVGPGAGLIGEPLAVLLGVQPGQGRAFWPRIPAALRAMSTIAVELVSLVSKSVAALGSSLMGRKSQPPSLSWAAARWWKRGRRHGLTSGDQSLDGEGLGECLAVAEDTGGGV